MRADELRARWGRRIQPARGGSRRPRTRVRTRPADADLWLDTWLIEDFGRVSGFALIGPCRDGPDMAGFAGEVSMLYVHPDRFGRGLGRALFEHVLALLARRGYYWSVVWVLERNWLARGFYHRMGFEPDGARRRERFSGRAVPVVRYAKALNPVLDLAALTSRAT